MFLSPHTYPVVRVSFPARLSSSGLPEWSIFLGLRLMHVPRQPHHKVVGTVQRMQENVLHPPAQPPDTGCALRNGFAAIEACLLGVGEKLCALSMVRQF